jgi:hypothetical protein
LAKNRHYTGFVRSKRALALPITFMILFVSTLGIISVTYYFSVERINMQTQTLKASTAKQNMLSLDNAIQSTLGQPGASATYDLADSGGITSIKPNSTVLTLSVNDSAQIDQTIFNTSVGMIAYYCAGLPTCVYVKGDGQPITSQTGASLSQVYIAQTGNGPEIQLSYRPTISYTSNGLENGKAVTEIRVYIVNLNASDRIVLQGDVPLKISCINTQLTTNTYEISYQPANLAITATLNGAVGSVSIPISSTSDGAVIHVETVVSNVSIEQEVR